MQGTSQAVLGSSEGISQPVTISKSEKIPALLYLGKGREYRPFCDFRRDPSAYQPQAEISNHRRACTQALLLHIIAKSIVFWEVNVFIWERRCLLSSKSSLHYHELFQKDSLTRDWKVIQLLSQNLFLPSSSWKNCSRTKYKWANNFKDLTKEPKRNIWITMCLKHLYIIYFSLYLCNFHIQMKMGESNLWAPFSFKFVSKCNHNRVFYLQNLTRFRIDIFVFISL